VYIFTNFEEEKNCAIESWYFLLWRKVYTSIYC